MDVDRILQKLDDFRRGLVLLIDRRQLEVPDVSELIASLLALWTSLELPLAPHHPGKAICQADEVRAGCQFETSICFPAMVAFHSTIDVA